MQCWQCGADVQPGDRTCGYCGARLTSPPAGRSQRSSQQRYSSSRNVPRRSHDDEWEQDAPADSDYAADNEFGDESTYGAAYRRDDRRGGRKGPRSNADEGWDDPRQDKRRQSRGGSRSNQQPDDHGDHSPSGYDKSGIYDDDYASKEYDSQQPDPLNDPRAPRNLRSSSRRDPDSRSGRPQDDAAAHYSREGSRDDRQQMQPGMGDSRSRRPPTDPTRDRRRDEGGYRRPGYGSGNALPPLTQENRGVAPEQYEGQGRSRRSYPSSADNRFGRSSVSRGQPSSYDERYDSGRYDNAGYDDGYGDRQNAPGRGYGRRMPPDEGSSYQQASRQGGAWQQRWERWGDTISGFRIPGTRQQDETTEGKPKPRRLIPTIVTLLVLGAVVVAGGVVAVPRLLARLHPTATTSSLCLPSGPATAGVVPTPAAHFKQFSSSRSLYGVNYPETWTVEPQQKVANGYDYIDAFTLPNSTTSVNIEQAQAACALSDINIIQGEVAAAQQTNITITENTSAATTQTIGSEQWQRREYDVSDKGVTLHMVILATHHQGRAYVIVLVSSTTTFKQNDTGIFEPMLKSFTFTK